MALHRPPRSDDMVALRPTGIRKREAPPRKKAHVDALITSEEELAEFLEKVDNMGEVEAKERLKAIAGHIWDGRKKTSKGRKIRRLEDL